MAINDVTARRTSDDDRFLLHAEDVWRDARVLSRERPVEAHDDQRGRHVIVSWLRPVLLKPQNHDPLLQTYN